MTIKLLDKPTNRSRRFYTIIATVASYHLDHLAFYNYRISQFVNIFAKTTYNFSVSELLEFK